MSCSLSRTWAAFSPGWTTQAPSASHRNCSLEVCFPSLDKIQHLSVFLIVRVPKEYTHLTEAHWSSLPIILCWAFLPINWSALLPSLVQSANRLKVHPIPLDQIIDKDIKQNWLQCQALMNTTYDQLPTGFPSFTTSLLAWPSSRIFMQKTLFFLSSSERSLFNCNSCSYQLVCWHMGMVRSCTFKIFFLENVPTSWNPLPFRTASQKSLSTRLLNKPKTAFWTSIVAVLLIPTLVLWESKTLFMVIMLRMASQYDSPLLPIHKNRSNRAPSVGVSLTTCVGIWFSIHSRTVLDCLLSVLFISILY